MASEVNEITLTFPEFITHIPMGKGKWDKIGLNKIYTGVHFSKRGALVSAMHGYLEKHIPENLTIHGPIETSLFVHAPINFGGVRMILDKETGQRRISWEPAKRNYKPNWDINNLATIWLKCLDDVLVKKGIIKDDSIQYLQGGAYRFVPVTQFRDRKLVYKLKTITQ